MIDDYANNTHTQAGITNYWSESTSTLIQDVVKEYPDNKIRINPEFKKLLKKNLKGQKRNFYIHDHYLYFCGTIHYLKHVDHRYMENEFVPINYKIMSSIISKTSYYQIISDLIRWGVIECNKSYCENRSKGYRLMAPYNTGTREYVIQDRKINEKLNKFKKKEYFVTRTFHDSYRNLEVTNTWIKMDTRKASYYNTQKYFNTGMVGTYEANMYSISAYKDGNYRFKVDTTGFRAHTNLTNLKSDLRKFLTVRGQPLGQVDIKNSQPLFFYLHVRKSQFICQEEKEKYRFIVEQGRFYEFFLDRLGLPGKDRSRYKKKILAALFFDKNRKKESRYVRVFREEFPELADYIYDKKKNDHAALATVLQRAESEFIIEKAVTEYVRRFGRQYEFISTIHDSLVVTVDMLENTRQVMEYCFRKEGINPILSATKF